MKIIVDMGHGLDGQKNSGAVGLVHESKEVRIIGKSVIKYLKGMGHEVIDITYDKPKSNSDSLNTRVNRANKHSNADVLISLHLNAFNSKACGSEVLTYNGKHMIQAERILNNLAKLGFTNRGIKNGTSPRRLAMINSTKMPSMIIESFFVDSKADVDRYNKNKDAIARAIVEGVTGQSLSNSKPEVKPEVKPETTPSKGDDKMTKEEVIKLVTELMKPSVNGEEDKHWVDESYKSLTGKGIEVHDKRFDDSITRAEVITLLDRVVK